MPEQEQKKHMPGDILLVKRTKRVQLLGRGCCWGFFPGIGK